MLTFHTVLLWEQPFASALVSVNLRDDGTSRAGSLFLHRTVFGDGEGKGGGCLHFDAKMIRHAWHYSWLCSWGQGAGGRHNQSPASECHQIRSREVEGQKFSTCHPDSRIPHLYAPAKRRSNIVRCRVKNNGSKISFARCAHYCNMGGGWQRIDPPMSRLCRAARGPSQRANAGQYMRGGSGGRSVWNSHMFSPRKGG